MKHYVLFTKEELCDMICGKEIKHTISDAGTLYFMCKDYFGNEEELENPNDPPDLGYVEFEDGRIEEVLSYSIRDDILRFTTPSGKYVYQSWVDELDSGHKYRTHRFYDAMTGITQPQILTVVFNKPR